MSFTSTYAQKPPNYKGMSMTVGVHALIFAGVMALPAITKPPRTPTVVETYDVKVKPEPVKEVTKPDKPLVDIPPPGTIAPIAPIMETPVFADPPPIAFAESAVDIDLGGAGTAIVPPIEVIPDPVVVDAKLNTRFRKQFQPDYPPGLLRMEEEGLVTVRVLVGANGRARQIELIDTPHEGFWTATKRHALRKWRFNPATRDGKPFESWITLKVQFKITS